MHIVSHITNHYFAQIQKILTNKNIQPQDVHPIFQRDIANNIFSERQRSAYQVINGLVSAIFNRFPKQNFAEQKHDLMILLSTYPQMLEESRKKACIHVARMLCNKIYPFAKNLLHVSEFEFLDLQYNCLLHHKDPVQEIASRFRLSPEERRKATELFVNYQPFVKSEFAKHLF